MADNVRLQVRENSDDHDWVDVGHKAGDETIPVEITSSALPTGASTLAEQQTQTTHLSEIEGAVETLEAVDFATEAKQDTIIGHVDGIETILGTIDTDTGNIATSVSTIAGAVSANKMQVDVISTPNMDVSLSTRASEAKQDTQITHLSAIETAVEAIQANQLADGYNVTVDNTFISIEQDGTALGNNQVTVDTTVGGVTIVSASAGRQGVLIKNVGSVACFIGTGSVTSSNGLQLLPGEALSIPTDSDVKGITASSSTTVAYLSAS